MATTIATVTEDGVEFGAVFFDGDWCAYGLSKHDIGVLGPYGTAKEAALALADEPDGEGLHALTDRLVLTCERHDAEAA
jgi:hypothetical protein